MEALASVVVILCVITALVQRPKAKDDCIYEPIFDLKGQIKTFRKVRR